MDRGAWWAKVHVVAKNRTWLKWVTKQQQKSHCLHQSDDYSRYYVVSVLGPAWSNIQISHKLDQQPWTYLAKLNDVRTVIFSCYYHNGNPFKLWQSFAFLFSPASLLFSYSLFHFKLKIMPIWEMRSNTSKEVKNSRNIWYSNIIPSYLTSKLYLHPSKWSL